MKSNIVVGVVVLLGACANEGTAIDESEGVAELGTMSPAPFGHVHGHALRHAVCK